MWKSSLSARKPHANLCQKRYHIMAIILIKLSVMVFGVSAKDTFTTVSPTLKQYGFLICSIKERILSSLGRLRSIFTFRISTSSSKAFPFLALFFPSFLHHLISSLLPEISCLIQEITIGKRIDKTLSAFCPLFLPMRIYLAPN